MRKSTSVTSGHFDSCAGADGARPPPPRRRRGSRAGASMHRARSSCRSERRPAAARGRLAVRELGQATRSCSPARGASGWQGETPLRRAAKQAAWAAFKSFNFLVLKRLVSYRPLARISQRGSPACRDTQLKTHTYSGERKSRTRHRARSAGSTEFDPWRPSGRGQACWAETVQ